MAIARVNAMQENCTHGSTVNGYTSASKFASLTGNNAVVAFVRTSKQNGELVTGLSDSAGNTYVLQDSYQTADPTLYMFYKEGITGGTNVTFTVAGNSNAWAYAWIYGMQFSGVKTSAALDVGVVKEFGAGNTDQTTDAFSAANTDSLIVVAATGNYYSVYSAGTGFTLESGTIGEDPGPSGNEFGGLEYKILSGAWSSTQAHITSTTNGIWSIGYIVLKAAGGAVVDALEWMQPQQQPARSSWPNIRQVAPRPSSRRSMTMPPPNWRRAPSSGLWVR